MKRKKAANDAASTLQPGMGSVPHEGGVTFRVWAPNASAVTVVGTFNDWDDKAHPLAAEGDGYWAVDVPGAQVGDEYKYAIRSGEETLHRLDPYGRAATSSIGNTIIDDPQFNWEKSDKYAIPTWNELVIYEMHIGTFNPERKEGPGTFQTAIDKLPYLRDLGINAIEVMPPMEFPGGISWGYNPALPFSIESDYGGPHAFKSFVKAAHEQGIAVLLDVVYNHLGPSDLDLWRFDGWSENGYGGIYFYNDGRANTPWGDTRPDYGRPQVRQYLRDNAVMWLNEYDVDGLRWDATAYIRNVYGADMDPAHELPDGWSLMQWLNEEMAKEAPNKLSIAEDLRGNEWLVKGTGAGGAGFGSQWDKGFVDPVRTAIISNDDNFRDLQAVAGSLQSSFDGNVFKRVIYTESHDEVANGKARVPEEIWPGNSQHWFAKKRSTLGAALLFTAPGIPMIFQGQEFLEGKWFDDRDPLDWGQAEELQGFVHLYRDLIALRRNVQGVSRGLTGQHIHITHLNNDQKVLVYHRWMDGGPGDSVMVALNFRDEPVKGYKIGFPAAGTWKLRFDSHFGGYDPEYVGQVSSDIEAQEEAYDSQPYAAEIALAPYSAVIFSQDS